MKRPFLRSVFARVGNWFGLHPEVGDLISGGFRLTNPGQADLPSENLHFASRLIASGIWNYCFFQFYRNFVGPYWVERQYNPRDVSFIPRAVSPLSINVTHRTWMGFRGPNSPHFAMMDPAGAVSPVTGYYTLEFAIREGKELFLSTRGEMKIKQKPYRDLPIASCEWSTDNTRVHMRATGSADGLIILSIFCTATRPDTSLIVSVRPFNPEGATLIHRLAVLDTTGGQKVRLNGQDEVFLPDRPERVSVSNLKGGDAYFAEGEAQEAHCPYGIATAAMSYRIEGRREVLIGARTYERNEENRTAGAGTSHFAGLSTQVLADAFSASTDEWTRQLAGGAVFQTARPGLNRATRIMSGYLLSLRTGNEITPGSFTYRTFFFRDAAYMIPALIEWNFASEVRAIVYSYAGRQKRNGFFRSQKGEWDSTGQAIWTLVDYCRTTGDTSLLKSVYPNLRRGVRWIWSLRQKGPGQKILPPGFSAEHLGPADSYYWDNLWSLAGIRATQEAAGLLGETEDALRLGEQFNRYANDLLEVSSPDRMRLGVIPPAPGRGVEAGMIGSIAELYPLELSVFPRAEMKKTVETVYRRFFSKGLFFHPIIHSGYNVYLSLQMAQCFFRLGQIRRARRILNRVLKKRTQMWTYPEAIHPLTGGGVMGDGFHGWAFAEVLLLIRRFTLYRDGNRLEIFRGLRRRELFGAELQFGPFPMDGTTVSIQGEMGSAGGRLTIRIPDIGRTPIAFIRVHVPGAPVRLMSAEGARASRNAKGKILLESPTDFIQIAFERG